MRAGLLVLALAGCPHAAPTPVLDAAAPPAVPQPAAPLVSLLEGVGDALVAPPERQAEDVGALSAVVAAADLAGADPVGADPSGVADLATDRLRLALLLALGDVAVRDDARARALLEGRAWDGAGYETIVNLVLAVVREREARAEEEGELTAALEAERRRVQELEARLEAIKAIETEIHREEGTDGGQAEGPDR